MIANLPSEDERHALIDALMELVEKRGAEPLVSWPVLLPLPEHFPDPWSPDLVGVRLMTQRLMTYAGLGDLDVELEPFVEEEVVEYSAGVGGVGTSRRRHGAAAWFRGIRDTTCQFGVEISQLGDPEQLVGVLAHEVSHAYRAHHGLMIDDLQREEQLTDLTTIFLGFGVLTTNATDRFRSSGEAVGGQVLHRWQRQQTGYLSPPAMSFLLAAQSVARGASLSDRRRIKGHLERNQAASFVDALSWLEAQSTDLLGRIQRPVASPRIDVAPAPFAMLPKGPVEVAPNRDGRPQPRFNAGHPVFRLRASGFSLVRRMFWGMLAGLVLAIPFRSGWPILAIPGLVMVLERWVLRPFCTGCDRRLGRRADSDSCPNCGGVVAGDINRMRDRHDAEDRYWAEHGGPPEWMTAKHDVDEHGRTTGSEEA